MGAGRERSEQRGQLASATRSVGLSDEPGCATAARGIWANELHLLLSARHIGWAATRTSANQIRCLAAGAAGADDTVHIQSQRHTRSTQLCSLTVEFVCSGPNTRRRKVTRRHLKQRGPARSTDPERYHQRTFCRHVVTIVTLLFACHLSSSVLTPSAIS